MMVIVFLRDSVELQKLCKIPAWWLTNGFVL